jgi:hypothetical protein
MEESLLSRVEFYASGAWGNYYPNSYYFTIEVYKTRAAAGLTACPLARMTGKACEQMLLVPR